MSGIEQYRPLSLLILQVVNAKKIFLLGTTQSKRITQSIFVRTPPVREEVEEYFILVLIAHNVQENNNKTKEKIEAACHSLCKVTAFVIDLEEFNEWLQTGHPFASAVIHKAITCFDDKESILSELAEINPEAWQKARQSAYTQGLNKAKEFLAGADLFTLRQQNRMAAFMLHQAVEHALLTILKMAIGVKVNTHNLDKLIRYCSMIGFEAAEIFPRKAETDKKLFQLLQRAYVESRYGQDYNINYPDLVVLSKRAADLLELVKSYQQSINRLSGSKM